MGEVSTVVTVVYFTVYIITLVFRDSLLRGQNICDNFVFSSLSTFFYGYSPFRNKAFISALPDQRKFPLHMSY